jgi:hypothetical protein
MNHATEQEKQRYKELSEEFNSKPDRWYENYDFDTFEYFLLKKIIELEEANEARDYKE